MTSTTRCTGGPAEANAESYLSGTLPKIESERFEEHYLACAACHDWLLALKDVQDELRRLPLIVPRPEPKRFFAMPVRIFALASLAAALLVGLAVIGVTLRHDKQQGNSIAVTPVAPAPESAPAGGSSPAPASSVVHGEELASLADLKIPRYREPMLRGAETASPTHRAFIDGMDAYEQGDYSGAAAYLAQVPSSATDGLSAELFLGLCQLQRHDWRAAQISLEHVTHSGDTPQLETAEYFLAQTMLEQGNLTGAQTYLAKTIALHGDYEGKAFVQQQKLQSEPQR